jgi:hypothetical protein
LYKKSEVLANSETLDPNVILFEKDISQDGLKDLLVGHVCGQKTCAGIIYLQTKYGNYCELEGDMTLGTVHPISSSKRLPTGAIRVHVYTVCGWDCWNDSDYEIKDGIISLVESKPNGRK